MRSKTVSTLPANARCLRCNGNIFTRDEQGEISCLLCGTEVGLQEPPLPLVRRIEVPGRWAGGRRG